MRKIIATAAIAAMLLMLAGCSQPEPQQPEELEVTEVKMVPVVVEHEPEPEPEPEISYEEEVYYYEEEEDWSYYEEPSYHEDYEGSGGIDLRSMGVVEDGGTTYTWYSENVLPGNGLHDLNNNGRTTNDEGFVVDGDGYIAIAAPDESIPIGTEVDTPWGAAKVYDYNDGYSYDVYTSW